MTINKRRLSMPQIGLFTREKSDFRGRIDTLTLCRELVIVPTECSGAENAPDYRIHSIGHDGPEVGAAWKRIGENAGEYLSVLLDDPALPHPIRANLFRDDDAREAWSLYWTRPKLRDERG
jgi:uncharacterized protein (DUF736 family)